MANRSNVWIAAGALVALVGCTSNSATSSDASGASGSDAAPPPVDAPVSALPALTFCQVTSSDLTTAFTSQTTGDAVSYACVQPCPGDWTTCTFGYVNGTTPVMSARGGQMQALAFVVDGIGGHFVFTPDGTDVVVTQAGDGGLSNYNPFDIQIQKISTIKTVSMGWEKGTPTILGGGGWFTRKDGNPTSTRAQAARPAAAIQWAKNNLAVGYKLGTVGSSMGTAATFGAHVWYGLDPIIDYQLLIGGPAFWDVNAACGRVHIGDGHCDTDASACSGNPSSSYGNNDPVCGTDPTDNCRVPTVAAPIANGGSAYNNVINYLGIATSCVNLATDSRDPSLDDSSLAMTVQDWNFRGKIDFVTNEGGSQPPNADQGMGEGHMLAIYTQIQSSKGWTDNQGYHHGDSWDIDVDLMAAGAALVKTGMGD